MTDNVEIKQALTDAVQDPGFVKQLAIAVAAITATTPVGFGRVPADQFTPEDVLVPPQPMNEEGNALIISRRPLETQDSYVVIVQRVNTNPAPQQPTPAADAAAPAPTAATDGPTPEAAAAAAPTDAPATPPTYVYHMLVYREEVIGDVTKNRAVGPSELVMKELQRQAPLLPMDEDVHFFYCALVTMVPSPTGAPVTPVDPAAPPAAATAEPSAADGPTPEQLH